MKLNKTLCVLGVTLTMGLDTANAACCGFELAQAVNSGLQTMTKVLQGTESDGRSLSSIKAELENVNNNMTNQGKLMTSLQSAQQAHAQKLLGSQLQSFAEITKREQVFKATQDLEKAYGSFNEDEACAQYDQAIQQIQGQHNYQGLVGTISNSYDQLFKNIKHPTERTEAVLSLEATDADDLFPANGFYDSPESAAAAIKASAFIVNPYPLAQLEEDEWKATPFGEKWKEENNILAVRTAPIKAAVADIIAGNTPSFPLDERMKSVLELSPYSEDQVTINGEISKNLYLELLASSRYYNPKFMENITAAQGDELIRQAIYSYSDLLLMENETFKVEQQNTALLAVIASSAINARMEERLNEAAAGVARH